jgi:3'-5' exoribonuclease
MQLTPISDLEAGSCIERIVLVRDVESRSKRDGSTYLRMRLADRWASVPAVLWDDAGTTPESGTPCSVVGKVEDHPRYGRQVTVKQLHPVVGEDVPWEDLLDGPERDASLLESDLDLLVASLRDPHLRKLLDRLLGAATETGQRYRVMPAAKYHHHAYRHGLLDHSVSVAQLVSAAAVTLPSINRDLAVAGALLHDVGKLEAYDADAGGADLSDVGKLLGEIPLGFYRVRRAIEDMPDFPPQTAEALLHAVLSHHGRLEHGSPVVPCTREATLVHAMDELSGRMGAFDRLAKETPAGTTWSRFDRVLESSALLGR